MEQQLQGQMNLNSSEAILALAVTSSGAPWALLTSYLLGGGVLVKICMENGDEGINRS